MPTQNGWGAISAISASGDSNINAVIHSSSSKWGGVSGTGAAVTFSFPDTLYFSSGVSGYFGTPGSGRFDEPWNGPAQTIAVEEVAARDALAQWAAVSNIAFSERTEISSNVGEIRFTYSGSVSAVAHAYVPHASARAGDVWLSYDMFSYGYNPGQKGHFALMHEIGHAGIGLTDVSAIVGKNGATLSSAYDHSHYTIMSYRRYENDSSPGVLGGDLPTTPMWYDISGAQHIYGANTSYNSGDTNYTWGVGAKVYMTVWDGGGVDTIDWSNQSSISNINLATGVWNSLGPSLNLTDYVTSNANLIIYEGVVIENAHGGSGADQLSGNQVANTLKGNGGNDVIYGFGGNDTLSGGSGTDTLYGGAGIDTADYSSSAAGVDVRLFNNTHSGGDAQGDSLTNIENITGSAFNDYIDGDSGANTLIGGAGDDILYGYFGDDTILGGDGNDNLGGQWGDDTVTGGVGDDTIFGHDGTDTLLGGAGADTLYGGAGIDTFVFNAGDGNDNILDFATALPTHDVLDYSSQNLSFSDLTIVQSATVTLITNNTSGDTVALVGIIATDLDQGVHFIL